jgi:SAM-dependent methyltransferase
VSTSLVYRSAAGYELLMRILYGRHYEDRMGAVAAEVPRGSSVLELCCGPGTLYTRHLATRAGSYVGLDVNERFVSELRRRGIDTRLVDLSRSESPLPPADVLIMQASLYHFLPHPDLILDRMLAAARQLVIISEPIRNLASSAVPLIGSLGRRATDPGVGGGERRFTEHTLDELFEGYRRQVLKVRLIPGGREKLFVLRAGGAP